MTRNDVIKLINKHINDYIMIHANGLICRESFAIKDRPQNFYMLGSMGLASCIGLGIAIVQPNFKIVILDGDGNVFMNIGGLALIGAQQPRNLIHIVLDNGVYASTGNQRCISRNIDLDTLAKALKYKNVKKVTNKEDFEKAFINTMRCSGPSFLHVKIKSDKKNVKAKRISYLPPIMTLKFRKVIYGRK